MIDKRSWSLYLALMLVFACTRWPGLMPHNFSAALALFLCTGAFIGIRRFWWIPLVTMLLTDIALNLHYAVNHEYEGPLFPLSLLPNYLAYGLVLCLGGLAGSRASIRRMLGSGAAAAALFYLVTNTAAFLNDAEYPRTLSGWVDALTIGKPGFPPTWTFFRNSLVSTLLFTSLFTLAWRIPFLVRGRERIRPGSLDARGRMFIPRGRGCGSSPR